MQGALLERAEVEAARFGLDLQVEFLGTHAPTLMSANTQQAIASACDILGLTHIPLVSGAGHDGQMLAALCTTGMLFVPSVGGASHSPRELTEWEDCVNGANVLLHAALLLAGK
jgi:N-carbamoyl-L-amino-acid hydrolase